MTPEEIFGETLRRARRKLGLSQTQIAAEMSRRGFSFHQTTIGRTENGERPLRLNEAVTLAQILHLSFTELLVGHIGKQVDLAAENAALRRTLMVIRTALDEMETRP